MLPCVVSPAQCTPLSLPLCGVKFMDKIVGWDNLFPISQQESCVCCPVPSPVLVALRCGHRSWGTDPQTILSLQVLGGSSPLGEGGVASEIQHSVVERSSGPGAECLVSDPDFTMSAVGESGNLSEPQFPCLQSRDGVTLSCMGLLGAATMIMERIAPSTEEVPKQSISITAPAEGTQEPGVVTMISRHSQLCAAQM